MRDLLSVQMATLSTFSTIISRLGGRTRFAYGTAIKRSRNGYSTHQRHLCIVRLSQPIDGCGLPFYLSCNVPKHWRAANAQDGECDIGHGETAGEAVARLWLLLESK
jgi:hypothetical protein